MLLPKLKCKGRRLETQARSIASCSIASWSARVGQSRTDMAAATALVAEAASLEVVPAELAGLMRTVDGAGGEAAAEAAEHGLPVRGTGTAQPVANPVAELGDDEEREGLGGPDGAEALL